MKTIVNRRQPTHAGVGAASIIMVFMVLCLTALGVLSLSSARVNRKLAQKRTDYIETYYAAEAKLQHMLAAEADKQHAAGETVTLASPLYDDGQAIVAEIAFDANGAFAIQSYRLINERDWTEPEDQKWNTGPGDANPPSKGGDTDFLFD